jgi:thiol-disulfide isomerase/thioredoxin
MKVLSGNSKTDVDEINKSVEDGKNVFILVYMDGCGPCMATKPEWHKMANELSGSDDIVIADVNKNFMGDLKYIRDIDGFPTIKHIGKKGKYVKAYEDSNVKQKDRSAESFKEWIKNHDKQLGGSPYKLLKRLSKKRSNKNKMRKTKKIKRTNKKRKRY